MPHGAEALDRLRRPGLRRQGRPRDPRPPLHRRQHGPGRRSAGDQETAENARQVPRRQEGPRRHLRPARGRRRSMASCWARSAPMSRRSSRAESTWSRSWCGRSGVGHLFSQGTVDSNEIWVELIARSGDRVIGRSGGIGAGRHGRSLLAFHQRLHARPRRQPDRPPQPAGHLRAALQQADPPGAGQVVHFGLDVPEDEKARSRWRPRSTTASSTGHTWTTFSARGKGPSCRSS